jgi:hypothetical protein
MPPGLPTGTRPAGSSPERWRADHPPNRAVTELGALTVHDLHNPPTDRHPERRIAYGAVLRIR